MRNKFKGFTLVELIVVMAIFSVILFGAMSLMPTVSKIMTYSDVQQEGSAAVSSITAYLENELSPVEYLDVYNTNSTAAQLTQRVHDFAETYYEGVLRDGSTGEPYPASHWASGTVHAITIDNSNGGKISHYTYDCGFTPGLVTESGGIDQEWAVNAAYYDNYDYLIKLGAFDDPSDFTDPSSYPDLVDNMNPQHTQFTILGQTTRGTANPQTYNFTSTASLALVNIVARGGGGVNTYYVINQSVLHDDPSDPNLITGKGAPADNTIVNITAAQPNRSMYSFMDLSRRYGQLSTASRLLYDSSVTGTESYTFIYSYATEIDTSHA